MDAAETENEFASTMQQLAAEAEKSIPARTAGTPADQMRWVREDLSILNERIGGLGRMVVSGFEKLGGTSTSDEPSSAAQLARMEEQLIAIRTSESVNHRLFNSLHEELKHYRDNFLRESLQKPVIRDLVLLLDDLTVLDAQMESPANGAGMKKGVLRSWHTNLENAIHSLIEILHRMEVNEIEPKEKLDRAFHRVLTYQATEIPEEDGLIVQRVKRGFIWHGQVLRPEEVVVKRFN